MKTAIEKSDYKHKAIEAYSKTLIDCISLEYAPNNKIRFRCVTDMAMK